jgi:hypothetical protein
MKFEIMTEIKMTSEVFLDATLCNLVGGYQSFGETYRLHLQAGGFCDITKQKIAIGIFFYE